MIINIRKRKCNKAIKDILETKVSMHHFYDYLGYSYPDLSIYEWAYIKKEVEKLDIPEY